MSSRTILCMALFSSLTGCGFGGGQADLAVELRSIAGSAKGKVPALPVVRAYEPQAYTADALADPFAGLSFGRSPRRALSKAQSIEMARPKQFLEQWPLE